MTPRARTTFAAAPQTKGNVFDRLREDTDL